MVQVAGRNVDAGSGGEAPAVEASQLTKRYGDFEAVKAVNFSVDAVSLLLGQGNSRFA